MEAHEPVVPRRVNIMRKNHITHRQWVEMHINSINNATSADLLPAIWSEVYQHGSWNIDTVNALIDAYGRFNYPLSALMLYNFVASQFPSLLTPDTFARISNVMSVTTNNTSASIKPTTIVANSGAKTGLRFFYNPYTFDPAKSRVFLKKKSVSGEIPSLMPKP